MRYVAISAWGSKPVHIVRPDGKTYCQTENVHRRHPLRLVSIKDPGSRRLCMVCVELSKREPTVAGVPDADGNVWRPWNAPDPRTTMKGKPIYQDEDGSI